MPYLTPDSLPDETICYQIQIPNSVEWIGLVKGALSELLLPFRWEEFGSITPAETVARCIEMYDDFVLNGACGEMANACCNQPLIHRFLTDGTMQASTDGGLTWQPAWDDPRQSAVPALPNTQSFTRCQMADAMSQVLFDKINDIAEQRAEVSTLTLMLGIVVGIIFVGLELTGVGVLLTPLLIELASTIISITAGEIAAFTTDGGAHLSATRCAIYCAMDTDGNMTDGRWLQAIGTAIQDSALNTDVAAPVLYDLMKTAGWRTIWNEATLKQIGTLLTDCSDCTCTPACDYSDWEIHIGRGTIISQSAGEIVVEATKIGGSWWIDIDSSNVNECCCFISYEIQAGSFAGGGTVGWYNPCTVDYTNDDNLGFAYTGQQANRWGLARPDAGGGDTGFTMRIFSAGECP